MYDFDEPDEPTLAPCAARHDHDAPASPVWCHPCNHKIYEALEGLPAAYAQLANTSDIPTREKPERAPTAGPGNVPPEIAHADEILRTVCGWDDELRRHLGTVRRWWQVDHRYAGRDLFVAVEYLLDRHTPALSAPFAVEYGRETLALASTADDLLSKGDSPVRPSRVRLDAPCPECGRQSLFRANAAEYVACANCGAVGTEAEYRAQTLLLVAEHGAAPPAAVRVQLAPLIDEAEEVLRAHWDHRWDRSLEGVLAEGVAAPQHEAGAA